MELNDLTGRVGGWLQPSADIIVSSRVRLARNLAGFPFLPKAEKKHRQAIKLHLREAIDSLPGMFVVDVEKIAEEAKRKQAASGSDLEIADLKFLVERHLISQYHAGLTTTGAFADTSQFFWGRVAAISEQETASVMVNEEDHIRIQTLRSGLQLQDAWNEASRIDDLIEASTEYAFHSQYGYLTTCTTNTGTGLRVSAMLHLPCLRLTKEMDKVLRVAQEIKLAIRGLYGEGTETTGDFCQISNQTTLGRSEDDIIAEFSDNIQQVVACEEAARKHLVDKHPRIADDMSHRAIGVLGNARILTSQEAMFWLSSLRLGVILGHHDIGMDTINRLFIQIRPTHLQKIAGRTLDETERDEFRADLVRRELAGSK